MEKDASDSRTANLDAGPRTLARSWSRMRSLRVDDSAERVDSTGARLNQIQETTLNQYTDTDAVSRFIARTDLVYVRPQRVLSNRPDCATTNTWPSPSIENDNHIEGKSSIFQRGQIESDGGQSGPVQHNEEIEASVRTELHATPQEDFANK